MLQLRHDEHHRHPVPPHRSRLPGRPDLRFWAFEESRPADVSSSALETALTWLKRHGPVFDRDGDNLADLIKDELDFRSSWP